MEPATPLRRLGALLLDFLLFLLTLIVGYIIWWLIVLQRGQTPGKQLLGIRAVRRDGNPAGWGLTFGRELVKFVIHSLGGIGLLADAILLLMDDDEHRSLADRAVDTVVIRIQPTAVAALQSEVGQLS